MPIVRILLVHLALASPALAQDGARDAAAAREAAQAFRVYVEGVTKKGGRPDLTGRRSPRCSAASSILAP
jgi:hypothetical protein